MVRHAYRQGSKPRRPFRPKRGAAFLASMFFSCLRRSGTRIHRWVLRTLRIRSIPFGQRHGRGRIEIITIIRPHIRVITVAFFCSLRKKESMEQRKNPRAIKKPKAEAGRGRGFGRSKGRVSIKEDAKWVLGECLCPSSYLRQSPLLFSFAFPFVSFILTCFRPPQIQSLQARERSAGASCCRNKG